MILGSDGQRLSKRHGAVNVMQYKDDGYLPDAMVNYLARLGWSHGDDEVFSRDQLVEWFDLGHVSRSPARWDPEKLKWMNGEYLRRLAPGEIVARLRAERGALMAEVDSRMDAAAMLATAIGDMQTFRDAEQYLHEMSQPVAVDPAVREKHLGGKGREVLGKIRPLLADVEWAAPAISGALKGLVQSEGLKMPEVMMPLRIAVTGREKTKAIDGIVAAFKREEVLGRLERAMQ
jgi:glutamyl-tRNA synthetase